MRGSDVIERCAVKLDLQRGRALFAEAPRPLGTPLAHVTIVPGASDRHQNPTRAAAELEYRAARGFRLFYIEADVAARRVERHVVV